MVWPMFKFLFDSNVSLDNLRVEYMRSIFRVGYPNIEGPTYGETPEWGEDFDSEGWEKFSEWTYDLIDNLEIEFPEKEYQTYQFASGI